MKREMRVHGVEAARRESHRRFGGAPVPADFQSGAMAVVRAARQRAALGLDEPPIDLWPAAGLASVVAVLAVVVGLIGYASGDLLAWLWMDDPLIMAKLVARLLLA